MSEVAIWVWIWLLVFALVGVGGLFYYLFFTE